MSVAVATEAPATPTNGNAPALRKVSGSDIVDAIKRDLEIRAPQLQAVLPKHIEPARFVRVVLTALWQNQDLLNCSKDSILRASMRCAQDGLVPDGREAALVKFGTDAAYMPMVFGIVKKLRQSGEIAMITARIVYTGEIAAGRFKFVVTDGEEKLTHEPMFTDDRGTPAYVYAAAKFKDGTVQYEVLTRGDVEKVRGVSRAKNGGPWKDWWEEMAKKTAIRRLAKLLPLSAEDRRIFDVDDEMTEFQRERDAARNAVLANAAAQLGAPVPLREFTEAEVTETEEAGDGVLNDEAANDAEPPLERGRRLLALCADAFALADLRASIADELDSFELAAWDEECTARAKALTPKKGK